MDMTYKSLAGLAAEVERAGDLSYAETLWEKAATVAKKSVNRDWAECRKDFCKHWCVRIKNKKSGTNQP